MVWSPGTAIPTLNWWQQLLLILAISIVMATCIRIGGAHLQGRSDEGSRSLGRMLLEELHTPLYRSVLLLGIYTSAQLLSRSWLVFLLSALAMTGAVLQWSWTASRIGVRSVEVIQSGKRSADFVPVIRNIWKMSVFTIGRSTGDRSHPRRSVVV